jgi:molybdenum-dependent DNA-binding transcriptional regulator ModE
MAPPPLKKAFLRKRMAEIAKAGSLSAAAQALKVSYSTLQHQVRMAVAQGLPQPLPRKHTGGRPANPPMQEGERRTIGTLRAKVAALEKALAEADRRAADADRFREVSAELHDSPVSPPTWALRVPAAPDSPGVPVLFLSDWHIGETVDAAQVHHANAFNAEIADRRVKTLVDRALWLCFQHVKAPEYPGIVVVLGGDFVSGWLHEELFRTDWCAPTQAANWCASRLHAALVRLADAFGRVHAVCVPGNHGRLTKRPMAKGGPTACFDHAIYESLADRLREDARITFQIPASGDALFQVQGVRFLALHGHELGVKGGDGLIGALGPIMRGAIKTGRAERSLGRDFDVLLMGHYHQPIWQPRSGIIVNGTLKGYDEYSRQQRFAYTPPVQFLFFVHHRFGCNLPFDIFLEDPPAREAVKFVAVADAAG